MLKKSFPLMAAALCFLPDVLWASTYVYVSNSLDGDISIYGMSVETGELIPHGRTSVGGTIMAMARSPDNRRLYVSMTSSPPSLVTYAIDPTTGGLSRLAEAPLPAGMDYISVDRAGRRLFGASYDGDLISVSPIGPEGDVEGPAVQTMITGKNAHAILPDPSNRFVFATNLGSDRIMQLVFDETTGLLRDNALASVPSPPGAGPRHLVFAPDGGNVYVVNELAGTISRYAFDASTGRLTEVETTAPIGADAEQPVSSTPGEQASENGDAKQIWAADIHVTPDGRFVYASERVFSAIAVFAVNGDTGALTQVKSVPTEKQPRAFQIDPRGKFLIACGEKSDWLAVYHIDQADGGLRLLQRYPAGRGANWVLFVETSQQEQNH